MLRAMELKSIDDLFADIPASVRTGGLEIPKGMDEQDVVRHVTALLRKDRSAESMPTFLGAGLYDHFVPASVRAIASRAEFYTAYTPYQAELSQGILQTLWEYQSFICELTGMDAANTSMYDGSTALGEAALMAHRITGKKQIVIPRAVHWEKRDVLRSYTVGPGLRIIEVGFDSETPLAPTPQRCTSRIRTSSGGSRRTSWTSGRSRRPCSSSARILSPSP